MKYLFEEAKLLEWAIARVEYTGAKIQLKKGIELVDHQTGEILTLIQDATGWRVILPDEIKRHMIYVTFYNKDEWVVGFNQNEPLFLDGTEPGRPVMFDEYYKPKHAFGVIN